MKIFLQKIGTKKYMENTTQFDSFYKNFTKIEAGVDWSDEKEAPNLKHVESLLDTIKTSNPPRPKEN